MVVMLADSVAKKVAPKAEHWADSMALILIAELVHLSVNAMAASSVDQKVVMRVALLVATSADSTVQ